jgi:acyl-coenzyme A synthetase/AMP-(fatty) acid ligase
MINIVGKRNSLAFLNQILLSIPGVKDGLFCMQENEVAEEAPRLLAFVVAPNCTSAHILAALRQHVDPVFLPRPLIFIDALARDANGKITASDLAALRATHLSTKT